MKILVSGATATMQRFRDHPNLGILTSPRSGRNLAKIAETGQKWACDNDAFSGFNPILFRKMILAIACQSTSNLLWVACPDVVADAPATLAQFEDWEPEITRLGLPTAFVGQDGAEDMELPWDRFACLFVGGTTQWKESRTAMDLTDEASKRHKLVHVGRVNTFRRLRKVFDWGTVDTIDGTSFSRWPDRYIPLGLQLISRLKQQSKIELS